MNLLCHCSELKGRDLLGFDSYSTNEILTTLWTALDLKVTKVHKKINSNIALAHFSKCSNAINDLN